MVAQQTELFAASYSLMGRLPHVVLYYLREYVFPEVLKHQGMKLSASGQELGGDLLFGRRLGFSGTPRHAAAVLPKPNTPTLQ